MLFRNWKFEIQQTNKKKNENWKLHTTVAQWFNTVFGELHLVVIRSGYFKFMTFDGEQKTETKKK